MSLAFVAWETECAGQDAARQASRAGGFRGFTDHSVAGNRVLSGGLRLSLFRWGWV